MCVTEFPLGQSCYFEAKLLLILIQLTAIRKYELPLVTSPEFVLTRAAFKQLRSGGSNACFFACGLKTWYKREREGLIFHKVHYVIADHVTVR